ncbi:MAG: efflux RND transporter periplasmic adaptor subunit [Gammaproteobacteria bacterium]|nr:efflux RND transporter periplasmic adaptor subunit [Gammaproteobacteria bacterium]
MSSNITQRAASNGFGSSPHRFRTLLVAAVMATAGCDQIVSMVEGSDDQNVEEEAFFEAVGVVRGDIRVAVEAAGGIEPVTTVEVKSKASGEILELNVDTGDTVETGTLLARIDQRILKNSLDQAKASLEVSRAELTNAESQLERIQKLYEQESLSKADYEQSLLQHASAKSQVVRGEIQVENAAIALEDTDVRAPISGTVIERLVEQGQVISSPMGDVGGGTLLLQMADLARVRVRMLVDEIDIGKVQPGTMAQVNVAAYPTRSFEGAVLKVEPQASPQQNVTMFPVLIDLDNREGLLKPGMNAEVELVVADRADVLTIPNAALRTPADVHVAGGVVGLSTEQVDAMLAASTLPPKPGSSEGGAASGPGGMSEEDMQMWRSIMTKRRNGEELNEEEQAFQRKMMQQFRRGGGGPGRGGPRAGGGGGPPGGGFGAPRPRSASIDSQFGGDFIVYALRDEQPVAVRVRTGVTDLDRTEIVLGLTEEDEVLILPSASLIQAQEAFQQQMRRWNRNAFVSGS